jgi:uncharacterized protein (TIGR02757 family)
MDKQRLKEFFDKKVDEFNQPFFITDDPVGIPHLFSKPQDIEIAGFFAAIFAWGNRKTIIQKSKELLQRMDMQPHTFCVSNDESRLRALENFKHRTFNDTDLLYFVDFFNYHYNHHQSLETAFTMHGQKIEDMLNGFHHYFFSLPYVPARTRKHIASPSGGSTCKRMNMFLRWMVRRDNKGVDFGIWKNISPSSLICPIDLHVARVAKHFHLLKRKQVDWRAAVELSEYLRTLDKDDPVKYDFALFGLGVIDKF